MNNTMVPSCDGLTGKETESEENVKDPGVIIQ